MQAYYAGAIDVELLRKQQERIRTNNTTAERQLRHLQTSRDKLHTALDQCLLVLHDGQQQYLAATDNSRRDLNQAVFDKIYLDDDEITNSQHKAVYHYLLDRGFEPLTFSLRTRRATSCAIAPSTGRW